MKIHPLIRYQNISGDKHETVLQNCENTSQYFKTTIKFLHLNLLFVKLFNKRHRKFLNNVKNALNSGFIKTFNS